MAKQILCDGGDFALLGGGDRVLVVGEVQRFELDALDACAETVDIRGLAEVVAVGARAGIVVETVAGAEAEAVAALEACAVAEIANL